MPSAISAVGGRGPYRNGVRTREQIIAAAINVFGELGFAGGSIRTIADRVGVSPATLLQHFGSKEGLLMAVLEEWDRRTTQTSLTGVTGLTLFRRLPEVMEFHLHNRGLLELFLTMAAEASSQIHPAREFIRRRYADNIITLGAHFREAAAAGEVAPLSQAEIDQEMRLLIAVLDGIELQWLLEPSTDLVASVTTYINHAIARWQRPI